MSIQREPMSGWLERGVREADGCGWRMRLGSWREEWRTTGRFRQAVRRKESQGQTVSRCFRCSLFAVRCSLFAVRSQLGLRPTEGAIRQAIDAQ